MSRGLLLDLDGTLCDSLPALRGAYDAFLCARACSGTDAEFEGLNGARLPGIVEHLRRAHGLAGDPTELEECYAAEVAVARRASQPMEGAAELLEVALRCGWRTAVVTSGTRLGAEAWLAEHRLSGFAAVVVGGEDSALSKPAPEPYLVALEAIGCSPRESVAVEDSSAGLCAALGAGLETYHFAPLRVAGAAEQRGVTAIAKLAELIPRLERVG